MYNKYESKKYFVLVNKLSKVKTKFTKANAMTGMLHGSFKVLGPSALMFAIVICVCICICSSLSKETSIK